MRTEANAQQYFLAVAVLVTAGLVLQLVLAVTNDHGSFDTPAGKVVNYLSFFTVLSNITVAVTHGMLARRIDRSSTAFRVMRIVGVLCIAVTGVVFHLALADLQELTGWDRVADTILHTLSPLLAVLGWVVFGPRRGLEGQVARLAILPPIAWLTYALARGALVQDRFGNDYYAYPFMNAQVHGYAVALLRCAMVAVLFLGLAYGALALDRHLPDLRSEPT